MLDKARKGWQELKRGKPGKRFQDRYERRHESGGHGGRRVATIVVGLIILAAGIFFLPAPGPGIIIVALGAGLLAQESLLMARGLDWAEVRVRKVVTWAVGVWERSGPLARAGIILLGVATGGAAAYLAWRVMFGS